MLPPDRNSERQGDENGDEHPMKIDQQLHHIGSHWSEFNRRILIKSSGSASLTPDVISASMISDIIPVVYGNQPCDKVQQKTSTLKY